MVNEIGKLQLVCTGNCSTISQAGLKGSLDYLRCNPHEMQSIWKYYYDRTSFVVSRLQQISEKFNFYSEDKSLYKIADSSSATFYVWADFGCLPRVEGYSMNDIELSVFFRSLYKYDQESSSIAVMSHSSEGTFTHVGVAAVPGSAFEVDSSKLKLRFSCACDSMKDLTDAMNTIEYGVGIICKQAINKFEIMP